MSPVSDTDLPRSMNRNWTFVGRSSNPSTLSMASSDALDYDTLSLLSESHTEGNSFTDDGSLRETETLDGETVDEDEAFTITSTPGGGPPRGSFASKIVEVTVGSGNTAGVFKIHKAVLTFYSPYFKSQLGDSNHITLRNASPRLFDVFVHWLYTRNVPEGNAHDTSSSTGKLCTRVLCMLWVFSHKYRIKQLQKDMVTKIVERVMHSAWKDPNMHVSYVYEHARGTCLQELVMDLVAYRTRPKVTKKIQRYGWMREHEDSGGDLQVGLAQPKDLSEWDLRQYHYEVLEDME